MAKIKTIYDANAVMHMIGEQKYYGLLNDDFHAALDAHKAAGKADNKLFNIALHFFILGIICGKKAERAKRGHKEYKPIMRGPSKPQ